MPSTVFPPYRTLPLAHPKRFAAERAFCTGSFRKIHWQPEGEIGACAATVARAMARGGGTPILGLQIHIWPELFIEALPHYVWRRPDGILWDLTDKYPTDTTRHSVFVPYANDHDLSLDHGRYFVLRNVPQVTALISAGLHQARNRRRIEESIRARKCEGAFIGLRLLNHAESIENTILQEDERRVALAICACRNLAGKS